MGKFFGTDGVRGKAGEILTADLAMKLGKVAGKVLSSGQENKGTIIIGRDSRISGEMLNAALSAGLMSAGIQVIDVGMVPTPAVAYLTRYYKAMAGAVISASHNPYADNGIKFFNAQGQKLSPQQEEAIESGLASEGFIAENTDAHIGRLTYEPEAVNHYVDYLQSLFQLSRRNIKVVIDCANGASSHIASKVFEKAGIEVSMLANEPDGLNINVACGSTHPEALQKQVVALRADAGFAFDGDADRFLAVDENGQLIDGDQLMAIFALDLKKKESLKNNQLVATVMSNLGLKIAMQQAGIEIIETKVGDKYVNEALEQHGAILGGEQSGHIIFKELNSTGDGLISAIMLLNIMSQSEQALSELTKVMKSYPQVLVNVPVLNKQGWEKHESITELINEKQQVLGERGRILVRASGTENLLRVMVEGENQTDIDAIAHAIADKIRMEIGQS